MNLIRHIRRLTERYAHAPLAFCGDPAARVIDQYLAHHARGERHEMVAVLNTGALGPDEA